MKTSSKMSLGIAFIVIFTLVFSLNIPNPVGAQTAGGPAGGKVLTPSSPDGGGPVPGGPGYVTISGLDFRPYLSSSTYFFSGSTIYNAGSGPVWFIATFQIPNGVTINKMVVYYIDQDAGVGKDLEVDLLYMPLAGSPNIMATFLSSGTLTGLAVGHVTSITLPLVNLSTTGYALQIELPASSAVGLNAIRIDYGYQTNLTMIQK